MDPNEIRIPVSGAVLAGTLVLPEEAKGIVLFAHGSGSSRSSFSPRNTFVARALQDGGFATLLFDFLSEAEDLVYAARFDIDLMALRLEAATRWVRLQPSLRGLPIGYFGASSGSAAALVAAASEGDAVRAVVSRGGRPDLAMTDLPRVKAPTLLIVGGNDAGVVELNRRAYPALAGEKRLEIVPEATHLFEEPGTLEQVARLAQEWFTRYLAGEAAEPVRGFRNRVQAGRLLAPRLERYRSERPVVAGIPRGGVVVAHEIARALGAPLELAFVRKLRAPGNGEPAIGAVFDGGGGAQVVLNPRILDRISVTKKYLRREISSRREEIRRWRRRCGIIQGGVALAGRTVILADDGAATGASMLAAIAGVRRAGASRIVLALPVAPPETIERLRPEADEIVCLLSPERFSAVGEFYREFAQVEDFEVVRLLSQAAAGKAA